VTSGASLPLTQPPGRGPRATASLGNERRAAAELRRLFARGLLHFDPTAPRVEVVPIYLSVVTEREQLEDVVLPPVRASCHPDGYATNPAVANPFQFTGRENDGVAGLYYYRARYYHPGLQRFVSEDPVRVLDPNLYAYVFNNSSAHTDPLGPQPAWLQKAAQVAAILLGFSLNPGTVPPPAPPPGIEQPPTGPGGVNTENVPRPGAPRETGPRPIENHGAPESPTGPKGPGGPKRPPTIRPPIPPIVTGVGPLLAGIGTGVVIVLTPSYGNDAALDWCAARGTPRCIVNSKSNK